MFLGVVGLNHKTAPVAVRERLAFAGDALLGLLSRLASIRGIGECCVLSTCNRTEFYLAPEDGNVWSRDDLLARLDELPDLRVPEFAPYLYVLTDGDAVEHLFAVTSGLDSMVVGETQIACQVKDAFSAACDVKSNGALLNRLFHQALETGKKVRSQTKISEGSLSVSLLACDLARKIFSKLSDKTALLVGAGETAELTARHLKDRGVGKILVANRTLAKAEALAKEFGGEAVALDDLPRRLADADVVIAQTSATDPVVRADDVRRALAHRHGRSIFLIDLGVPRDVDPAVSGLSDVFLYDLDDLGKMVEENRRLRAEEMERARKIVEGDARRYEAWTRERLASPTIAELQAVVEEIRKGELARLEGRLSPEDMEAIHRATRAMMAKVLSHPIMHLKDATTKSETAKLIDHIRDILGLHGDPKPLADSKGGRPS
jgi:glutamyl-tRNA reductase